MKPYSLFWIATLFIPGQFALAASHDAGFVELYNGKDVGNFEIHDNQKDFQVKEGVIHCDAGGKGGWILYKKEKYKDFTLRVEWRVSEGGNSGVFIRAGGKDVPWTDGYEVQISCEQPRRDASHCTGALYGYKAVDPRPDETAEKWRVTEITCKGPLITVKVDDETVCELDQSKQKDTKNKALSGFIGVQDSHGPEGTWVEYRSIKVKALE